MPYKKKFYKKKSYKKKYYKKQCYKKITDPVKYASGNVRLNYTQNIISTVQQ